jgi:hypothetical protein
MTKAVSGSGDCDGRKGQHMLEQSTAISVGSVLIIITIGAAVFKAVGWFRGIVEKAVASVESQIEKDVKVIHDRIDRANLEAKEIRKEHVLRVDLDSHLNSFDKKLDGVTAQLNTVHKLLMREVPR